MKILSDVLRAAVLLGFALMQGLAPIAHAHVNGQNFDGHPHLEIEGMHLHPAQDGSLYAAYIEHDHSAVVTLPPEHRCKDVKYLPVFSGIAPYLQPAAQPILQVAISEVALDKTGYICLPPHSQAPPFRI